MRSEKEITHVIYSGSTTYLLPTRWKHLCFCLESAVSFFLSGIEEILNTEINMVILHQSDCNIGIKTNTVPEARR